MQFGLFHTIQGTAPSAQAEAFRQAADEIVYADQLGYHSAWLTEHHFSEHGVISDSLAALAYLAARTDRIRLGTAVTVLPFHDPVRVAETAAAVDLYSNGRLDFGVGRGYQWQEFEGFGLDMGNRGERFDEAIEVVLRAWTTRGKFAHDGQFWHYGNIDPQPKPIQDPHPPIWVATDSEDGLRRCVQRDWGVMLPQGTPLAVLEKAVRRYRKVLDEEGVAYDPDKLIVARALHVAETDEAAWDLAGPNYVRFLEGAIRASARPGQERSAPDMARNPFETERLADSVVFGSPDTCARSVERLRDLGIEHLIWFTRFAAMPHDEIKRSLSQFKTEVEPQLQVAV